MKLVFIHGRSQQGKDADELRRTWIDTWHRGLRAAGLAPPDSWDIRFPFYGDILDQLVRAESAPVGATARGTAAPPGLDPALLEFERLMLGEISAHLGADPDAHFDGQPRERGAANWEWVQAVLRGIDARVPWVGSKSLERCTRDVYYYLTLPHIRDTIEEVVLTEMGPGPCIVVGHSLGSVVGYNVLHQCDPDTQVKRYVTVGSPLGVHAVRDRLNQPVKRPACVGDWFNAFDERDVVALRALTAGIFPVVPEIRNHGDVRNHTENRHGIVGYLDDPVVAGEVLG